MKQKEAVADPKKSDHDQFSIKYNESILSHQTSAIHIVPAKNKSSAISHNHVQSQHNEPNQNSFKVEIQNSKTPGKKQTMTQVQTKNHSIHQIEPIINTQRVNQGGLQRDD